MKGRRPAATVDERSRFSCREHDGQGPERLHRRAAVEADGLQPKNGRGGAGERDEWLRAAWRVTVAHGGDPARLVFVDDVGADTSLRPLYAWSRRGERAHSAVPRNRGKNTPLLASKSVEEGMGPSLVVEGATTAAVFEAYVQKALAPTLCGRGRRSR